MKVGRQEEIIFPYGIEDCDCVLRERDVAGIGLRGGNQTEVSTSWLFLSILLQC